MKKKFMLTAFIIVAIVSLNIPVFAAAGTCEFIGEDKETRGDWIGKYGADGYIVFADESNDQLPGYAKLEHLDAYMDEEASFYVWWDESLSDGDDDDTAIERAPGALYVDTAKSYRAAACYYNNDDPNHYLVIDIGSETKYVSIYSLDYDENGRESEITVRDENDNILVNTFDLIEFEGGVYLKFKVSGKIIIEYNRKEDTPGNAVYCGIFFDPIEEAAPAVEESIEKTVVNNNTNDNNANIAPTVAEALVPVVSAAAPQTGDNGVLLYTILLFAGIAIFSAVKKNIKIKNNKT